MWKEERKGFFSKFPFGAVAFARLDDRLADDPVWRAAPRDHERGLDPMGLSQQQPNAEFFTTECYGGPKHFVDFPTDNKFAFCMITQFFGPHSRGTVKLRSADPMDLPIVDHNYLADPLDLTAMSEACALANEIIIQGSGTKDIIKGSWPSNAKHHTYRTREEWKVFAKDNATSGESYTLTRFKSILIRDSRLSPGWIGENGPRDRPDGRTG